MFMRMFKNRLFGCLSSYVYMSILQKQYFFFHIFSFHILSSIQFLVSKIEYFEICNVPNERVS